MPRSEIVRTVDVGGRIYRKHADDTLTPLDDASDYSRLDAMAPDEIEALALTEAEARPLSDDDWARVELIDPLKVPVTIRLDEDVVRWFKEQGGRYQTKINAVLRQYVEAKRRTG